MRAYMFYILCARHTDNMVYVNCVLLGPVSRVSIVPPGLSLKMHVGDNLMCTSDANPATYRWINITASSNFTVGQQPVLMMTSVGVQKYVCVVTATIFHNMSTAPSYVVTVRVTGDVISN